MITKILSNFKRNSRSFSDYEKIKKIVQELNLSADEYEKYIKEISKYIGI